MDCKVFRQAGAGIFGTAVQEGQSFLRGVHWIPPVESQPEEDEEQSHDAGTRDMLFIRGSSRGGNTLERVRVSLGEEEGLLQLGEGVAMGEFVYDAKTSPVSSSLGVPPLVAAAVRAQPVQVFALGEQPHRVACFRSQKSPESEDIEASFCVEWLDSERVVAGSARCLRIYDINAASDAVRVPLSPVSTHMWLRGIHGVLAVDRSASSSSRHCLAVGTYDGDIGLFDVERSDDCILEKRRAGAGVDSGMASGISHMCFARDGQFLLAGARRSDQILAFDTRMFGPQAHPVAFFPRICRSSQKRSFDVNDRGTLLATGHSDRGHLLIYDLSTCAVLFEQLISSQPINSVKFLAASASDIEFLAVSCGARESLGAGDPEGDISTDPCVFVLQLKEKCFSIT